MGALKKPKVKTQEDIDRETAAKLSKAPATFRPKMGSTGRIGPVQSTAGDMRADSPMDTVASPVDTAALAEARKKRVANPSLFIPARFTFR